MKQSLIKKDAWIALEDAVYTVKKSARAKYLSIRFTRREGMVITIPDGLEEGSVPDFLKEKRQWIEEKLNSEHYYNVTEVPLPDIIELRSLDLAWHIEYRKTLSKKVEYAEQANNLSDEEHCVIFGQIENREKCLKSINSWLCEKAEEEFVPWLYALSEEHKLPFNGVKIGNQKSRWGSCSSDKIIRLNQKLLFLPPEFVEHIFIHELCHTVHMNHSAAFWKLVAKCDPDYKVIRQQTRKFAWNQYVPLWADL